MNLADTEQTSGSGSVVSNTATTRLSGSWLHMARAVWLALVVPSVGLFVVGLPVYYQQLQRAQVCGPGACLNGGLSVKDLQDLVSHGFSVSGYAALLTIFIAIIAAIWCAVGFLLFWRRSDDWLALLAAFFLVMSGITLTGNSLFALELTSPVLNVPLGLVNFLAQSPVVIVASTLAIAALFQPLRQRIQAIIDHRFYRRKYDAARTVAAFSATLRNEVELTQISEHLVAVVRETMQPARISLWLRKSDHERKPNTQG